MLKLHQPGTASQDGQDAKFVRRLGEDDRSNEGACGRYSNGVEVIKADLTYSLIASSSEV